MAPIRYRSNEPLISPRALENLRQVLEERYLSPGRWVQRFEERWAHVCGVTHAVATASGTSALQMAMLGAGIGSGDEVVVPAMTCPDTLHAVTFVGATPMIVDIEPMRYGIDPEQVRRALTSRTKAILPVHLYGCPVDPVVYEVADRHGLLVIEDAAEAHGATSEGRPVGSLGYAGCFSFRGDKILGVGTGGMVTTNDPRLAERIRYVIGLASPGGFDRYYSTETCYSYEMSNVHAAIGLAQVDVLEETLARKRRIAGWYGELLGLDHFDRPACIPGHAWWKYSPLLRGMSPRRVHEVLLQAGIESMPPFVPMYRLPMFSARYERSSFPVAEDVYARLLSLPTSPYLNRADVDEIAAALHDAVVLAS